MEKFYNNSGTLNNGFTFERWVAEKLGGVRDGRAFQPDVIVTTEDGGEITIECKFFVMKPATFKKNAVYNRAAGIDLYSKDLAREIGNYCKGFDFLAVGTGDFETSNEPEDFELIPSEKAFDWLMERVSSKGSDAIGFVYKAETEKSGGTARRIATLRKNGFII